MFSVTLTEKIDKSRNFQLEIEFIQIQENRISWRGKVKGGYHSGEEERVSILACCWKDEEPLKYQYLKQLYEAIQHLQSLPGF